MNLECLLKPFTVLKKLMRGGQLFIIFFLLRLPTMVNTKRHTAVALNFFVMRMCRLQKYYFNKKHQTALRHNA